jgi:enoyl-[acyl-carrier protein] reductase II
MVELLFAGGGIKMKLHTRLCELLDIEYPLIQGAMAWIAGGKLAAAVSETGALGVIGTGDGSAQWLKREIDYVHSVTDKPFGVNLMLASPFIEEIINLVIASKVPVVTTGGGNPGRYMEKLKNAGIKVLPVVASQALARRLTRLGADAIIAEGSEAGGHIGEMTTMCLVPMMVDAVDVPVVAAGGIADGRGFMAALALGATGVQMGTRFICAREANAHSLYQEKIIKAGDRDTLICGISTNHPVRAIHNRFTRQYLQAEAAGASQEELDKIAQGRYPRAALQGEVNEGTLLAGQICGLVKKVEPAAVIVEDMVRDALQVKQRLEELSCPV